MKKQKRLLTRVIGVLLVALLAFSFAVPTLATENLHITIHNAEGLPAMQDKQFYAFQIFSGTPNKEGDAVNPQWGAAEWDNWVLADIQWGSAFIPDPAGAKFFLNTLKSLNAAPEGYSWSGLIEEGKNVFWNCVTAADVAKVLVGKSNEFMQAFSKYVIEGSFDGVQSLWLDVEKAARSSVTENGQSSDITVGEPGYYLIAEDIAVHGGSVDDATSEFILAVLGNQDIQLKASIPTVDKSIVDSENNENGDVAGIGDVVKFELEGSLPKNLSDYVDYPYYYEFHDTLSKGLTPDVSSITVQLHSTVDLYTWPITFSCPKDYDLKIDMGPNGVLLSIKFKNLIQSIKKACDQMVEDGHWIIPPSFGPSYWLKSSIVVTYSATLNSDAVIGSAGNPNDVYLEYSNDPNSDQHGNTTKDRVYVYSFGLDLHKTGSDSAHQDGLGGAGFLLSKEVDGKTYYAQFDDVMGEGDQSEDVVGRKLKGWTDSSELESKFEALKSAKKALDSAKDAEKGQKQTEYDDALKALGEYLLTSGENGKIPDVTGLDEGTYTLTEVVTPAGYNTMEPFDFRIDAYISKTGKLTQVLYYHPADSKEPVSYNALVGSEYFETGLFPETLVNQKAPFLPFTGGIGTIIFYVLGLALIGGAVAYFVISYRKRKKQQSTH